MDQARTYYTIFPGNVQSERLRNGKRLVGKWLDSAGPACLEGATGMPLWREAAQEAGRDLGVGVEVGAGNSLVLRQVPLPLWLFFVMDGTAGGGLATYERPSRQ